MAPQLTNPSYIAQLLKSHHLHTSKQFGQNFLIHQPTLDAIVATANIQPHDTVIEVGTGIGTLTQQLAQRAQRVIAFEIDTSLQPILAQTLHDYHNIDLRWQNFMQADIEQLLNEAARQQGSTAASNETETISPPRNLATSPPSYHFVSNLPYNAGTHILDVLLKLPNPPQSITVLLQKEVAQKIVARPPQATYLSNFFQTYGQATLVQVIPPTHFFPAPAVDSALLHVEQHADDNKIVFPSTANRKPQTANQITPVELSRFLHHGFANPRKMINKAFPIDQLKQASIDPNQRPENLTFQDWLTLYSVTKNEKKNKG